MQEKIIEIIVFILNEMSNNKALEDVDVNRLASEGYTDAEINTAFAWIFSKIESGEELLRKQEGRKVSHRVFHPVERKVLSGEAIGYLIQLKELGLLTDAGIETVIDRIMSAGYHKAGAGEVKMIVSAMLFDHDNMTDSGRRMMLDNNDTVH